jgi:hypothetical protein
MDFVVDFSPGGRGSTVEERRLQQIGYGSGTLNPPRTRVCRGGVSRYRIHWRYFFLGQTNNMRHLFMEKIPNTAHRPNLSGRDPFPGSARNALRSSNIVLHALQSSLEPGYAGTAKSTVFLGASPCNISRTVFQKKLWFTYFGFFLLLKTVETPSVLEPEIRRPLNHSMI